MSFNAASFALMAYGGNAGSIWKYNTGDNLASLVIGTINGTYFKNAFPSYGIPVRQGDLILATNDASKIAVTLVATGHWNNNTASVMRMAGPHQFYGYY